jgi:transposase
MDGSATLQAPAIDAQFVERFLRGQVDEAETRRLVTGDPEVAAFTLLAIQQRLAVGSQAQGAHTPSGAVPPYQKPVSRPKKSQRKRGAQPGHPGRRRHTPLQPDRVRELQLDACPDCGGELKRTGETRERFSEDIPADLQPTITKDVIHRDWCPNCRQRVEPKPPDVLPRATLGNRALVLAALLHFLQGLTLSQIVDTFNFHLRLQITAGGLVQMWHRLADILFAWYAEIHEQSLDSSKLHADETSWRVSGQTHWLWCFANDDLCYYLIDRSRGSPALQKFFTRYFEGTLISDFWAPYDAVLCADQQKCWPHLLRDAAAVDEQHGDNPEWRSFARRLTGVYRDAKKLHSQRTSLAEADYDLAVARLEGRLANLAVADWNHADARRLAKRLAKYGDQLLTFLWHEDVPSDNNAGERAIRPAVMIRKNSYANQSERGALTQSVLMSVFRTLRLRRQQPLDTILAALSEYNRTGKLPPLPKPAPVG